MMSEDEPTGTRNRRSPNPSFLAAAAAAFIAVAGAAALLGPRGIRGDQAVVASMSARDLAPAVYARDPFLSDPSSRRYLPWMRSTVAWSMYLTPGAELGFALLGIVAAAAYAGGMTRFLARAGGVREGTAAWVAIASAVMHPALGGTWFGVLPTTATVARSVWLGACPWVAIALWSGRRRWAAWIAAGIAANLHPLSGIGFAAMWATAAWIAGPRRARPGLRGTAWFAIGLAPTIAAALAAPRIDPAPAALYMEALRLRLGYLLFPWPVSDVAGYVVGLAPWIALAMISRDRPSRPPADGDAEATADPAALRRFAAAMFVAAVAAPLLLCGAGQAIAATTGCAYRIQDLLRWTRLAYFPAAILAVAGGQTLTPARRRLWILALAVAFVPADIVVDRVAGRIARRAEAHGLFDPGDPEFAEVCDWLRRGTPRGSLVACPSSNLRYRARRSITGCADDGGTYLLFRSEALARWLPRERERREIFAARDAERWLDAARRDGADYAVIPAGWTPPAMPPSLVTTRYAVYSVPRR